VNALFRTPGPSVSLGQIAEFIRGVTYKPSDVSAPGDPNAIACMRTKNIQLNLEDDDLVFIPRSPINENKLLRAGDILVSSANSWNLVGKCCWIPTLPYQATFGGFTSVLRANREQVFPRYLFHWFATDRIQKLARSFGQQTTNISNLNQARCLELEVPLPPLDEQRYVAAILDKADALCRRRKQALDLLDSFTQSVFLEMFGDPVSNPKGFPLRSFGEIGKLDRGVSKHRPRNDPILLDGPHPLIQTGDVANSGGYIRSYSSTYSDTGLKQSKLWPIGTLCITIAANIAETGILTFQACFPDSVVGFTHERPAMAQFVRVWLSFLRSTLEQAAPTVAQKNINLQILRDLKVAMPPFELIDSFAARLDAQSGIERRLQIAAAEVDALFSSLQHRAFSGQL
jgi:type I restriction enzyme, S subunit